MSYFADSIIEWYHINKRDLPWRETRNPYYIWLSEIILQQTRVNQGLNYYLKFIDLFPTVQDLANAPEDVVLKAWEGLGYYSRARNLHATAHYIVDHLNGVFPSSFDEILKLKGVGEYTAAAISSFAFDLPHAVLDGNVMRVISRFFGIETPIDTSSGKKEIKMALDSVFDSSRPLLFNQAIMEFGALQCVPVNPDCENCSVQLFCEARKQNTVSRLPVKSKKVKIRNRFFYYLIPDNSSSVFIQKRNGNDIWKGLYQFPLLEFDKEQSLSELETIIEKEWKTEITSLSRKLKHILSHQHIYIIFIKVKKIQENNSLQLVDFIELKTFPFPIVLANYIQKELESTN